MKILVTFRLCGKQPDGFQNQTLITLNTNSLDLKHTF